ncbi:unnamed protein product [Closterium sp. NIES-54]
MSTRKERSSSNGSPGTTPTPPPASGLQTEEDTTTRPAAGSTETPANQGAGFDPSMMEKFFSFMSFYEQHQQGAHAQSNNSNNNNNVTPMSLDGSSYARGNQQQQPTFAPYEPQRGYVSFMPQPQPAPGQERTLDALQVQSQFAHVLKLQTTNPFDGKDFFTWSFEFELIMEGAQILGFFDGSLPYPTNGTQYERQQYTYKSMMAYTILLRNITPTQQQNIRSYRGYGNSAELAYNHLKNLQLMAKGMHLEADSTTQKFKLYHGKGGLYIGKAVLKNNVFVLDFVPDLGTADSDGIVTFTSWTHPPDLNPEFSPEGFWYSHTIPEAERTRALVTIQHSAAAETTSAADEADWDEQNVTNASEEAGPLPFCSVNVPMDEDNPRKSLNAETFYYFADNGYVTPATVNTNEAERVGPNFIPDPEAGDEAAYPEDATLPRYSQTGLQILGLVTAVHGNTLPKEPATVQQALGGEHMEKWREAMDRELKALTERNTWKVVPISVARNKTILTGKWVFRVKTKADGTIEKFKSRWVVRGFDQEHGRDFTETFAPVS